MPSPVDIFSGSYYGNAIIIDIKGPSGKSLLQDQNQLVYTDPDNRGYVTARYPSTSFDSGVYSMCFLNQGREMAPIGFSLQTGVDAKDYS